MTEDEKTLRRAANTIRSVAPGDAAARWHGWAQRDPVTHALSYGVEDQYGDDVVSEGRQRYVDHLALWSSHTALQVANLLETVADLIAAGLDGFVQCRTEVIESAVRLAKTIIDEQGYDSEEY